MRVTLVGTGCGNIGTMTASAIYAIEHADLILGAPRLLESFPDNWGGRRIAAVSPDDIMENIMSFNENNPEVPWNGSELLHENENRISVAFSGDTGFYSGAKSLLPMLREAGIQTDVIPGISSLQLLSARLDIPWQDWKLVSAHGMDCDAVREIEGSRHTFFLTGGKMGPSELCMQISEAGFGDLQVAVAERLSYDDERICLGGARDFTGEEFDSLSVLLVWPTGVEMPYNVETVYHEDAAEDEEMELQDINQLFGTTEYDIFHNIEESPGAASEAGIEAYAAGVDAAQPSDMNEGETSQFVSDLRPGLPDSTFIRGDVPMTKRDIRAIIAGHMQTRETDVIWDVGAGTGSVTVELALQARRGMVCSVEKDPEAITLIRQNVENFGLGNVEVIEGQAPQALHNLPAPDRVFIGGSDGNMREIIEVVLEKNPQALICVTAILLETATETMAVMDLMGMDMELTQVSVNTSRKASGKHMMIGGNPIFVMAAMAREEEYEEPIQDFE